MGGGPELIILLFLIIRELSDLVRGSSDQPGEPTTTEEPSPQEAETPQEELNPQEETSAVEQEDEDEIPTTPCDNNPNIRVGPNRAYPSPNTFFWRQTTHVITGLRNMPIINYNKTESVIALIRLRRGSSTTPLTRNLMTSQVNIDGQRGYVGIRCRNQDRAGHNKCDTVGHIIGRQFGGEGNQQGLTKGNIFPQSEQSQQAFHPVEDRIAGLIRSERRPACIRIRFNYSDPSEGFDPYYPLRPGSFVLDYWIGSHSERNLPFANPKPERSPYR
jgi:hypothetical protein